MITLPIKEQAKQLEQSIILTIDRNNGFPLQIIHNLKKKANAENTTTKWVTFTYHSPLINKVTTLFKHTNLNITFSAINTIHNQISRVP
jgi:hypothetical protein